MANTKCYLCKNSEFKQRNGSVRDKPDLKIFECTYCGLVFLSSFDHIKDGFYENSGMQYGEKTRHICRWIKETDKDDERRFQYVRSILPACSLLDFGCGTGNFLLKAKALAGKAHGIELETRLINNCKKMNLTVYRSLSETPAKNRYDIITVFHVLEHMLDPRAILVELSKLLKDKGQIIIEVPNADDALLTLYNSKAFSNFTYWSCHLFLFNTKTLEALGSQAGLKINYIKQVQRYSLANHLFWLSRGKPGGHEEWDFLDSKELNVNYEAQLRASGKCDTLLMSLSR